MFMWQHIKPQGMWDRHKQRWSRPLPGPTQGRRASRQDQSLAHPRKSHWKIWHTYGFHLSQEAKTISKNKQKWTCFQNGKLNHWLPGSVWTWGWVHRIASVIARILSTPCWKMTGFFRGNCSFLENLFLSALISAILGEKNAAPLIWLMLRICTCLIHVRFLQSTGLVMKLHNFPFFVCQPQVATRSGASAVFLPLFYGCLNIFSYCIGSIFTGDCVRVLPTHHCSSTCIQHHKKYPCAGEQEHCAIYLQQKKKQR